MSFSVPSRVRSTIPVAPFTPSRDASSISIAARARRTISTTFASNVRERRARARRDRPRGATCGMNARPTRVPHVPRPACAVGPRCRDRSRPNSIDASLDGRKSVHSIDRSIDRSIYTRVSRSTEVGSINRSIDLHVCRSTSIDVSSTRVGSIDRSIYACVDRLSRWFRRFTQKTPIDRTRSTRFAFRSHDRSTR